MVFIWILGRIWCDVKVMLEILNTKETSSAGFYMNWVCAHSIASNFNVSTYLFVMDHLLHVATHSNLGCFSSLLPEKPRFIHKPHCVLIFSPPAPLTVFWQISEVHYSLRCKQLTRCVHQINRFHWASYRMRATVPPPLRLPVLCGHEPELVAVMQRGPGEA